MDKSELIKGIIKKFLDQIQNRVYTRSDFVKKYEGDIDIVVSFGYGRLSHVPYIAFVDSGQRIRNGIYPVVTYYRLHDVLFLAYGESINSDAKVKWGTVCENKPTILEYANQNGFELNKLTEAKYGAERYCSVFSVGKDNSMLEEDIDRLSQDIVIMIDEYRGVLHKTQLKDDEQCEKLRDVFNHTTSSYKFYWALSLLDLLENERSIFSLHEITIGMIANSWKIVMDGRQLGKQDRLYEKNNEIRELFNINKASSIIEVKTQLLNNIENVELRRILKSFEDKVPYYFLSPWIPFINAKDVEYKSRKYENNCVYSIWHEIVKINPEWYEYLHSNINVLRTQVEIKLNEYLNK